jgi:hypothetical protein
MKCKSCQENVPSRFAHAHKTNICPYCGKEIMDMELQTILNALAKALDDSAPYADQIEDWMQTNYSFKKMKTQPNDVSYSTASEAEESVSQRTAQERASLSNKPITRSSPDNQVSQEQTLFAKRAGIKPLTPKNIIEQIQSDEDLDIVEDPYDNQQAVLPDVSATPLDYVEKNELANIFETNSNIEHQMEIEKLKRLRSQGFGKIKRED